MRSNLFVAELDTGVGCTGVGVDGAARRETSGVLVEDNVALILNELRARNSVRLRVSDRRRSWRKLTLQCLKTR